MYFNMIKQIQLFGIDARLIKYSNDAFLVYTYAPYSSKTYNLLYVITSDLDKLRLEKELEQIRLDKLRLDEIIVIDGRPFFN